MSIDYKHTIHLPETRFAMKGDLPTREPLALAAWAESHLHARIQAQTASRPSFVLQRGDPTAPQARLRPVSSVSRVTRRSPAAREG